MHVVQNHAQAKEPFKVRDRPVDFSGTEYKKDFNYKVAEFSVFLAHW